MSWSAQKHMGTKIFELYMTLVTTHKLESTCMCLAWFYFICVFTFIWDFWLFGTCMCPACWFVQLCILVPLPTRSTIQRHSIRSPVESTIKMLISELAQTWSSWGWRGSPRRGGIWRRSARNWTTEYGSRTLYNWDAMDMVKVVQELI